MDLLTVMPLQRARNRLVYAEARHDGRMFARAPDHGDDKIFGTLEDMNRRIRIRIAVLLFEVRAKPALYVLVRKFAQSDPRVLEQKTLNIRFGISAISDRLCVLGTENDERLRMEIVDVIVAGGRQRTRDHLQYAFGADALVCIAIVQAFRGDHRDRDRVPGKTALDMH